MSVPSDICRKPLSLSRQPAIGNLSDHRADPILDCLELTSELTAQSASCSIGL